MKEWGGSPEFASWWRTMAELPRPSISSSSADRFRSPSMFVTEVLTTSAMWSGERLGIRLLTSELVSASVKPSSRLLTICNRTAIIQQSCGNVCGQVQVCLL